MDFTKLLMRGVARLGFVFAAILLAGCQSDQSGSYSFNPLIESSPPAAMGGTGNTTAVPGNEGLRSGVLRVGDEVIVNFADLVTPVSPVDDQIKSDGTITLIYNQKFQAAGKSVGELQADIRNRYVPAYFVNMTPTIKVQDRFYSVGGEVKGANRFLWTGNMTVLQAINTAGGFTDFANKKTVSLTRVSNEKLIVNCIKAVDQPELDLPVYPGDKIFVHKRLW
ncbi:MAG TPA: SLBB domain-containing protein [Verrucomicrobiae bacterium]|nr:SLBB domain-containing protein [Verrucomicrobiae bacterium]